MGRRKADESSLARVPSGAQRGFPETSWTLVRRCRDAGPDDKRAALERLVVLYWKPIFRFYQRALRLPTEDAKDVTQAFFARFIEKDFLKNLREEKSFRGFLKTACRRFLINHRKRGPAPGGARVVSLAEGEGHDPPYDDARIDAAIDAEFRTFYLEEALALTKDELGRKGKDIYFAVLRARMPAAGDAEPEYDAIAQKLGIGVFDVRNYLHAARKVLRRSLLKVASERSDDPEEELCELGLKGTREP